MEVRRYSTVDGELLATLDLGTVRFETGKPKALVVDAEGVATLSFNVTWPVTLDGVSIGNSETSNLMLRRVVAP